jgi:hypothetical protein
MRLSSPPTAYSPAPAPARLQLEIELITQECIIIVSFYFPYIRIQPESSSFNQKFVIQPKVRNSTKSSLFNQKFVIQPKVRHSTKKLSFYEISFYCFLYLPECRLELPRPLAHLVEAVGANAQGHGRGSVLHRLDAVVVGVHGLHRVGGRGDPGLDGGAVGRAGQLEGAGRRRHGEGALHGEVGRVLLLVDLGCGFRRGPGGQGGAAVRSHHLRRRRGHLARVALVVSETEMHFLKIQLLFFNQIRSFLLNVLEFLCLPFILGYFQLIIIFSPEF